MPSVTALRMDLGVTGRTKRHQVRFTMVAVFCQRLDVMHLIRFGKPTFFLALLTKRVCIHVSVTDVFPCLTIPTLDCGVSVVLFVPLVLYSLMFLTEPGVRQLGTVGVGIQPLWFPQHRLTSLISCDFLEIFFNFARFTLIPPAKSHIIKMTPKERRRRL